MTKPNRPVPGYVLLIATIAALAGGLRIGYVAWTGATVGGTECTRAARAWAQEGRLAHVFSDQTGDSAHLAPLYPILLGTIYRVVGLEGPLAGWGQAMIGVLATIANIALLPILGRRTGLSVQAGILAAIVMACCPLNIWDETCGRWEQPLATLALGGLLLGFAKLHDTGTRSRSAVLEVGVLIGLSALLSPAILPAVVLMISAETISRPQCQRLTPRGLLILIITTFLVISPWIVRNYRVFGHFLPLRSNFGLELWVGNNPAANGKTYPIDRDDPNDPSNLMHPYTSKLQLDRLIQVGEFRYMQERFRLAREWILTHPWRFTALTLRRIRLFWLPPPNLWSQSQSTRMRILKSVFFSISAIAAVGNLFRLHLAKNGYSLLWMSAMIGPSLIYMITHVDPRYRYPIFGLTVLMSCDLGLNGVHACLGAWGSASGLAIETQTAMVPAGAPDAA